MSLFRRIQQFFSILNLVRWTVGLIALGGGGMHAYKNFLNKVKDTHLAANTLTSDSAASTAAPITEGPESIRVRDEALLAKPPEVIWSRDPFLKSPGFAPFVAAPREYKLEAIIFDQENPAALIDGNMVSVGQILPGGVKVKKIGKSYVLLEDGDSLKELVIPSADLSDDTDTLGDWNHSESPNSSSEAEGRGPAGQHVSPIEALGRALEAGSSTGAAVEALGSLVIEAAKSGAAKSGSNPSALDLIQKFSGGIAPTQQSSSAGGNRPPTVEKTLDSLFESQKSKTKSQGGKR